jgi:hypothetical protein
MLVKDTSGNTIIVLDKDGILVNDGKIVIKNISGTSILDANGLTSSNFTSDTITDSTNQVITNTVDTDLVNGSLSFTLAKDSKVLFLYKVVLYITQGGAGDLLGMARVRLKLDGTTLDEAVERGASFSTQTYVGIAQNINTTVSGHSIELVTAGNHTIKLSAVLSQDTGTPHLVIYRRTVSYIILGS